MNCAATECVVSNACWLCMKKLTNFIFCCKDKSVFVDFSPKLRSWTESHIWQMCVTSLVSGMCQSNVAVCTYVIDGCDKTKCLQMKMKVCIFKPNGNKMYVFQTCCSRWLEGDWRRPGRKPVCSVPVKRLRCSLHMSQCFLRVHHPLTVACDVRRIYWYVNQHRHIIGAFFFLGNLNLRLHTFVE